jgi:2'-5' RNA ligase
VSAGRSGGPIRAFLALPLSAEQRRVVDTRLAPLRALREPVRWVPAENLHVTLRFFGDVGADGRRRIEERALAAAAATAPFPFHLGGPGAFPNLRGARVLWVGVSEGEAAVAALAARIEEAIEDLGFPREKRFHAHITAGRPKGILSPGFQGAFAALSFEPAPARAVSLHLMKSTLDPRGARYEIVREFPLTG